ncbi:pyridoxal 5'-phosphate synthase glutaminase subunit PdxT [Clostridium baratii]|uniref:pyridoxal 5'-phosphate synthase glutaminase subunit PdxT n=1 Tax=Clostridium baratii TaxID=1561 RepID=UPI002A74918B|nr:pyridoxal 5'-phosphate synthase glutaminase subunit PdxT [Clostridium baratii]MDY3207801.1 pyridoxal 5'-phosphate synthase glutaminase subunit PdxT [Clostridium baratii]
MKIGVLALQGGIIEHIKHIEALNHKAVEVKDKKDLEDIDAIILPGGESTTIGKLLNITNLMEPLKEKIVNGLPTFGTCAGMILLAKEIENDKRRHLAIMDIKVKRNAFGSQIDSFKDYGHIKGIKDKDIELVFIRAPYITEVGRNVEVLCKLKDKIVAARENNIFVTSFHPELTEDLTFLKYFLEKNKMIFN